MDEYDPNNKKKTLEAIADIVDGHFSFRQIRTESGYSSLSQIVSEVPQMLDTLRCESLSLHYEVGFFPKNRLF